jgi:hypothetical protein
VLENLFQAKRRMYNTHVERALGYVTRTPLDFTSDKLAAKGTSMATIY